MSRSAQNRRNRSAGKEWESRILTRLRNDGWDVERTRDTGAEDEGDLVVRLADGTRIVIEAKAGALHPGPFLNEAAVERDHYAKHRNLPVEQAFGVVTAKRKNCKFEKSFTIIETAEFWRLVERLGGK